MNKIGFAIILLAAGTLFAAPEQEQKPAAEAQTGPKVRREFAIKYLPQGQDRPSRVISLVEKMFPVRITFDPVLRVGFVEGSPAEVAQVEAFLKRVDVPERQFALTIYVLDAAANASQSAPLPAEIEPAVKEIRAAFPYKGFRLFDTVLLQGTLRSSISGMLARPAGDGGPMPPYLYNANYVGVNLGSADTAEVENFHFGVKVPVITGGGMVSTYTDLGIDSARLSIRRGQKVVVGKITVGPTDSAIFLVLTADIK